MIHRSPRRSAPVFGAIALAAALAAPTAPAWARPSPGDDVGAMFKSLSDQVGPALVTVKYILKIEAGGRMAEYFGRMADEGQETEITGLMIEPSGLVLVSNTRLGGYIATMMARMGQGGVSANPTEIRVIIGEESDGLKARILARDSDLDLAWIKIDDPKAKDKTHPFVDLTRSATPTIGDQIYAVDRMAKFFDHALTVNEGRLGGQTRKPRALLIPSGLSGDLGMPLFTADGKVIGIGVLQTPSKEDIEGGDINEMMGGGGVSVMILPAEEVLKATKRTKDMAARGEPSTPAPGGEKPEPAKPAAAGDEK